MTRHRAQTRPAKRQAKNVLRVQNRKEKKTKTKTKFIFLFSFLFLLLLTNNLAQFGMLPR